MLEALREFLRAGGFDFGLADAGGSRANDPAVAAAALLAHVAEADGQVTEAELATLRAALAEEFGLDSDAAAAAAAAGREADAESVDLFRFTSVLLAALDEDQRVRFVKLLWSVVFADGDVHELEDNLVWRIAELLGVSTRDRMIAKRAAARHRAVAAPTTNEPTP